MADNEHQDKHYQQMRFSARNAISGVGFGCGKACAISSAKGLLQGSVDELITMLGEKEAYAIVQKVADQTVKVGG